MAELDAYAVGLCGLNPFNPCGRQLSAAQERERARIAGLGIDAVASFLLATSSAASPGC